MCCQNKSKVCSFLIMIPHLVTTLVILDPFCHRAKNQSAFMNYSLKPTMLSDKKYFISSTIFRSLNLFCHFSTFPFHDNINKNNNNSWLKEGEQKSGSASFIRGPQLERGLF